MKDHFIPRTLWYANNDEQVDVPQASLHVLKVPLIILGEAGMGKTRLLQQLALAHDYARCTARQLVTTAKPEALMNDSKVLVIDALDELSERASGDTVERVLTKLGELGYPRFILSCRVADWRSATGTETIREQYRDAAPLQLHIRPFNDQEIRQFLGSRVGENSAQETLEHFEKLGFHDWLGNPQTLQLVAEIDSSQKLPRTRTELFGMATQKLVQEHKNTKADALPPESIALDCAGALCAALILSGSDTIARKAPTNVNRGELASNELKLLPGGTHIDHVLGTRLFVSVGSDRFFYLHRSIAEYLGARWLSKLADTNRKRRRLLSLLQSTGMVPASLRGLHAWLAQDERLARDVIAIDPLGFIEYGDTECLTPVQGKHLIQELHNLAELNPAFRNNRSSLIARGLAQMELIDEIRELIAHRVERLYGLRMLVVESLKDSKVAQALIPELCGLISNSKEYYSVRSAAMDVVHALLPQNIVAATMNMLEALGDEDSLRLALDFAHQLHYEKVPATQLARIAFLYALTDSRMAGKFYYLALKLPAAKIPEFLHRFESAMSEVADRQLGWECESDLQELVFRLLARGIANDVVNTALLLACISTFKKRAQTGHDASKELHSALQAADTLRNEALQAVLLDRDNDTPIHHRYWDMLQLSAGFQCTEADAIKILNALDPNEHSDTRWREVVSLLQHDAKQGLALRAAAQRFTHEDPVHIGWIEQLAMPPQPSAWEIKSKNDRLKQVQKEFEQRDKARRWYLDHLSELRSGQFKACVSPAKAYLGLFSDLDKEATPQDRLTYWLGEDIAATAMQGFEEFLVKSTIDPTASEVAQAFADGKQYNSPFILLAAMLERSRHNIRFEDIRQDYLLIVFIISHRFFFSTPTQLESLQRQIDEELDRRGSWTEAVRTFCEPQLQANVDHVSGLHDFANDGIHQTEFAKLAHEWLTHFPVLVHETEARLIDVLLLAQLFDELKKIFLTRSASLSTEHILTWQATRLLIDFEATSTQLTHAPIDPNLLWHIRDRGAIERRTSFTKKSIDISAPLLHWSIKEFRGLWPTCSFPREGTMGDRNDWDACQLLYSFINRLAADSSAEASQFLTYLRDAPHDSYTDQLKAACHEQARIRCEACFTPPSLDEITAIANDASPCNVNDLQTWVLEELQTVQKKIRSSDTNSWEMFFENGIPLDEERCRDRLLELLRQGTSGVSYEPEAHLADDKEADITCTSGIHRLPIEIKGQWHKDVWTAADGQLDTLYATDWRAADRGIYLVLWFGSQSTKSKTLKSRGRGLETPTSSEAMATILRNTSKAVCESRIAVVVLDLSRSYRCQA